ncbi:MAG: serine/threonine-protein kinase [Pirellulales bacterium]
MVPQSDSLSSSESTSRKILRFREAALSSGLIDSRQLDAVEQCVRSAVEENVVDQRAFDKAVALECVRQKILTKFQARELLSGHTRFTLGQYRMLSEIGRGGMGQVFKAEHVLMKRIVAVKVLPLSKANPRTEAAFQREIELLAKLDHDNIIRALDAGYDGNVYYLVTEYIRGIDLRKQVSKYGALEQNQAVTVTVQAAQGLAYAHSRGFVHRDVKPSNILVTHDGRILILDLGLAGAMFDPESMSPARRLGTPGYMSPEQIQSPQNVGPATDIYGLGCTLYYLLSGQQPFPGSSRKEKQDRHLRVPPVPLNDILPSLNTRIVETVELMMQPSLKQRISSAQEVIDALKPWCLERWVPLRSRAAQAKPVAGEQGSSSRFSAAGSGLGSESESNLEVRESSETSRGGGDESTNFFIGLPQQGSENSSKASPFFLWLFRTVLFSFLGGIVVTGVVWITQWLVSGEGKSAQIFGAITFLFVFLLRTVWLVQSRGESQS